MGEVLSWAIQGSGRNDPVSMAIFVGAMLLAMPIALWMHFVEVGMREARARALRGGGDASSARLGGRGYRRGTCPRCGPKAPLAQDAGALGDAVCGSCQGRFLPPAGVERLLVDELGFEPAFLRELSLHFAGARVKCPDCASRMSPLTLKGAPVDLCTGCGGLWLDPGELLQLGDGRHEEVAVRGLDARHWEPLKRELAAAAAEPEALRRERERRLEEAKALERAARAKMAVGVLGILGLLAGAVVLLLLHELGLF